ncbi:MAG: glycerate kinase [Caldilineaceae bacterium]
MAAFNEDVLVPNRGLRSSLLRILQEAIAAVDPYKAVKKQFVLNGEALQVGEQSYSLAAFERIYVLGTGKAGMSMARAIDDTLGARITQGIVIVKDAGDADSLPAAVGRIQLLPASHPVPDQRGVDGAKAIEQVARQARANDLVVALISGGGSALLADVAEPISLIELQSMTSLLLACGATINEINCLRKHCSSLKGGQLARAAHPATLITLVLSDVVGSPLDVIGSGPTVADPSSWQDAWAVVEKYGLADRLPATIRQRLQDGLAGKLADTPKADDSVFTTTQTLIIADNRIAALAAKAEAERIGYHTLLLSTFVEGEAAEVAKVACALAKEVKVSHLPIAPPACFILGGETTVNLGSGEIGKGGRNQELALASALRIAGEEGITIVSLATDGSDGPTDSAGAIVDGGTIARGEALGLAAKLYLRRHNAYPFLQRTNDLLVCGPTHTNVNDLIFVFVE